MQANFNFCHFSIGGNQQDPLNIYAVPNPSIPTNLLGAVVDATIGGMETESDGAGVVPLESNNWPYQGQVSDFHLDGTDFGKGG